VEDTSPFKFYEWMRVGSRRSAGVIVPFLMELLKPRSVLDAGCGTGSWLKVFQEQGVADFVGLDNEGVPQSLLEIAPHRFRAVDLSREFDLERRFDLALCLEAAHYIPAGSAGPLVACLTRHAPAVLFSAAIPGQGGGGQNQQWPEYWAEHFDAHGYACIDCVRPRIWHDPQVEIWYVQNALLFADRELLESRPELAEEHEHGRGRPLAIVHPLIHGANRQLLAQAQRQLARLEQS
jgi:SAM-dependent methyltransferase